MAASLEHHAQQLSALGHPVRLSILRFVVQGGPAGTTAGDIQAHVKLPGSTLSYHLRRLVEAGLFKTWGVGAFHIYAPDLAALRALTEYFWEDCCQRGGGCC